MQRQAGEGVRTLDISAGGAAPHNGGKQRCSQVRVPLGYLPATYHLLGQLVHQQLVLLALLFHLLRLLVVVDCQLLQGLQDFLHLVLSSIVL